MDRYKLFRQATKAHHSSEQEKNCHFIPTYAGLEHVAPNFRSAHFNYLWLFALWLCACVAAAAAAAAVQHYQERPSLSKERKKCIGSSCFVG